MVAVKKTGLAGAAGDVGSCETASHIVAGKFNSVLIAIIRAIQSIGPEKHIGRDPTRDIADLALAQDLFGARSVFIVGWDQE
jgi:hypothetical protein